MLNKLDTINNTILALKEELIKKQKKLSELKITRTASDLYVVCLELIRICKEHNIETKKEEKILQDIHGKLYHILNGNIK